MADMAAHLVDEVLPYAPVRQWVLSFPFPIRFLLAFDPALCAAVRRIFVRDVLGWYERRARRDGVASPRGGAIVVAQRFGGALNLNLHIHALELDEPFFAELCAASVQGRAAVQPHGTTTMTCIGRRRERRASFVPGTLCSAVDGFSLHANVVVPDDRREQLEHLCRYVTRPPIAWCAALART